MKFLLVLVLAMGLPAATLRYWVAPCVPAESGCKLDDPELAQWAMEAWQTAAGGALHLEKVADHTQAHIRIHWVNGSDGLYGETRPIDVNGVRGAEVYVLPTVVPPDEKDQLLRDAIVYLTCLHESGHALGLDHTAKFADIMYSFQFGGDIPEYFGRYRRLLESRADIRKHSGMSAADQARVVARFK
jgi:Matrixin